MQWPHTFVLKVGDVYFGTQQQAGSKVETACGRQTRWKTLNPRQPEKGRDKSMASGSASFRVSVLLGQPAWALLPARLHLPTASLGRACVQGVLHIWQPHLDLHSFFNSHLITEVWTPTSNCQPGVGAHTCNLGCSGSGGGGSEVCVQPGQFSNLRRPCFQMKNKNGNVAQSDGPGFNLSYWKNNFYVPFILYECITSCDFPS